MPRINWEWSPYKNPFGEDTPAKALARKWRHLILFDGGWAKAYVFTVLCMLYVAGVFAWWVIEGMQVGWRSQGILQWRAVALILPLFLLLRIHLASVPALTVCRDAKTSLWEYFRITTVSGDDVARAMLMHAFNYGVLPLAFVSTLETLVYLYAIGTDMGTIELLTRTPIIFLIYLGIGLIMTAVGMIGALIWRHALGVVLGIVGPIIILIILAGPRFFNDFFQSLWMHRYTAFIPSSLPTLLVAPETRIAFSETTISRGGLTTYSATDPMAMLGMVVTLAVLAGFLWMALWLVMRYRLRYG